VTMALNCVVTLFAPAVVRREAVLA